MNFLPQASGTRPRLACEITPRGVVAGRSGAAGAPVAAVARVDLAEGAIAPGLRPGNVADRVAVAAALKRAVEQVGGKPHARGADLTLVIPDGAVRVLLLDFDALSTKVAEALPLVRFRLKKLVPFDADEAMISYQVMSANKGGVRVLAVAIPRDVLAEYETAAREAGFEPGAVLPSTLAALAGVPDAGPVLLVNANPLSVTTAIAREGIVLLHLSVDLGPAELPDIPAVRGDADGPMEDVAGQTQGGAMPGRMSAQAIAEEIAQAVSKGAAYFEDTLAAAPETILSAGPLGAERLRQILNEQGLAEADGLRVREAVGTDALAADAATGGMTLGGMGRGWMAGVVGALRG